MKFGEIIAPSIKELFIQKIEGMILSGALKPGERLPTERELADEMNIRTREQFGNFLNKEKESAYRMACSVR